VRTGLACAFLLALTLAVQAGAAPRFIAVDVWLESPVPVAAWQFELASPDAKIVGVENGESTAFRDAPYYDREAVERGSAERLVVADFSLAAPAALPAGRIRIATLHLLLEGTGEPAFDLELVTAVDHDGDPIDASIGLEQRTGGAR
jgi:hypothetical protein